MNIDKILMCDVECYINYFLVKFKKISSGDIIYFEKFDNSDLNRQNILHIINKYTLVTFNGNAYDQVVIEAACQGFSNESLKKISDSLIGEKGKRGLQAWQARKQFGVGQLEFDHIDLIEVAPLSASLKIYGGRIHSPKMQDLPIEPSAILTRSQANEISTYCDNDLDVTEGLFRQLESEIDLRVVMSKEYGIDLRSKSDAQIAEAVIKKEMDDNYGFVPKRPKVESGTTYMYNAPKNLTFNSEILKDVFEQYTSLPFLVGDSGYVEFNFKMNESDRIKSGKNKGKLPENKKKMKFLIGNTKYTIGIGGLHSCEKSTRHTNDNHILRDYDVASYYPRIILNNRLFPKHIGEPFLEIYESIVNRRLKAKKENNKPVNESLKITINGSFGKLGSKWSCLYSPDLMLQVTVTGQLSLLMLIERLELAGIPVVSANTDGIVVKMKPEQEVLAEDIVEEWQFDTDYELESSDYTSLNSRDINNYIAIKKGGSKGKGAYADQRDHYYKLRSNPNNDICNDAIKAFLQEGKSVKSSVMECKDITKFLSLRTVNGGAIKEGNLIGKAIRWYYGSEELDAIFYSTNGNKVPKSDGGVPLMNLPNVFPSDVDFNWYINEANRRLKDIGWK
jgi:hypothetical protein